MLSYISRFSSTLSDSSIYNQTQSKNVVPTMITKVSGLGRLDLSIRGALVPLSSYS